MEYIGYHGTDKKFETFDLSKSGYIGFYFSPDKNHYVINRRKYIITARLIIDNPAPSDIVRKIYDESGSGNPRKIAHEKLKSMGYDGIIRPIEYVVFNPEQIKIMSVEENKNPSKTGEIITESSKPFVNFLRILKRPGNEPLIEAVIKGYSVIFENNESADLVAEARKFKSADEFIEAQGVQFIHVTDKDFTEFDISKTSNGAVHGPAVYGSLKGEKIWNPPGVRKNRIIEGVVYGKILDITKPLSKEDLSVFEKLVGSELDHLPIISLDKRFGSLSNGIREAGYSAFYHQGPGGAGKQIAIVDPSQIKTKAQLIDIWNKAHNQQSGNVFESIQYPPNFDVQELKKLNNFAARVRYVQTHLKKIGSGSARIVYEIDDKHVLKLAKNKKGIAQNSVEGDWAMHRMYDGILPDLIEKDDDNLWLIVERANKISKKEFERLTGVKFENFAKTLGYELSLRSSRSRWIFSKPEDYDDIIDNEFLSEIVDMSINFDMPAGDFERISTYGKVDDDPVVVDPGLTQSVYEEHYR